MKKKSIASTLIKENHGDDIKRGRKEKKQRKKVCHKHNKGK